MAPPTIFDWRALNGRALPGADTAERREQARRVRLAEGEVRAWADHFAFPAAYGSALGQLCESSATFAVICTPRGTPDATTSLLACLILWIYCLDALLDTQPPGRICDTTWIDAVLHASLRSLDDRFGPPLLRWAGVPALVKGPVVVPAVCTRLSAALAAFFAEAAVRWAPYSRSKGRGQFRAANVAVQVARCAGAMRQELRWSCALHRPAPPSTLPALRSYLAAATQSTGVHPVVALMCAFSADPQRAWERARPDVDAAARVVRLANDLYRYETDVAEGHLTAVTIALRDLGLPLTGLDPTTSEEVARARRRLVPHLRAAVGTFSEATAGPRQPPISDHLRRVVALALSIYGDGGHFSAPSAQH